MYLWKIRWSYLIGGRLIFEHEECPDVAGKKVRVDISVPGYKHIDDYPTLSEGFAVMFNVLDYSRPNPTPIWFEAREVLHGDFLRLVPKAVYQEYKEEGRKDKEGDMSLLKYILSKERVDELCQKVVKTDPSKYNELE
jgi:hypothetical protein